MAAGELHSHARAPETFYRLAVERLGLVVLAQQRSAARLQPQRPVSAGSARALREPLQRRRGLVALSGAHGRLDELGQYERGEAELGRMLGGSPGRFQRVLVAAEPVVEHGLRHCG